MSFKCAYLVKDSLAWSHLYLHQVASLFTGTSLFLINCPLHRRFASHPKARENKFTPRPTQKGTEQRLFQNKWWNVPFFFFQSPKMNISTLEVICQFNTQRGPFISEILAEYVHQLSSFSSSETQFSNKVKQQTYGFKVRPSPRMAAPLPANDSKNSQIILL